MRNTATLWDRAASILSYITFGFTGVIWLIASLAVFKKPLSPFLAYHIYQSVFLSILLYVLSLLFSICYSLMFNLPFIGGIVQYINLHFFNLPVYNTLSLSNFIVTVIISYLSFGALIGKLSYLPFVSDIIKQNIRG